MTCHKDDVRFWLPWNKCPFSFVLKTSGRAWSQEKPLHFRGEKIIFFCPLLSVVYVILCGFYGYPLCVVWSVKQEFEREKCNLQKVETKRRPDRISCLFNSKYHDSFTMYNKPSPWNSPSSLKSPKTVLDDDLQVSKYRAWYCVDHGSFPMFIV